MRYDLELGGGRRLESVGYLSIGTVLGYDEQEPSKLNVNVRQVRNAGAGRSRGLWMDEQEKDMAVVYFFQLFQPPILISPLSSCLSSHHSLINDEAVRRARN